MSPQTSQEAQTGAAQGGQTHNYQQPQEPDCDDAVPAAVTRHKLVEAFEQFIDSMQAASAPAYGGKTETPGSGAPGSAPGGSAPGTGKQANTMGQGGAGSTTATTGAGGQGSTGSAGGMTHAGGTAGTGTGSHESMGTGAQASTTSVQGGNGTQDSEAIKVATITAVRESFRVDRAREVARQARTSESAPQAPAAAPAPGVTGNKHRSDSNTAPIQVNQEFAPSYGSRGRNKAATSEVIAVRPDPSVRPETAPAPPKPAPIDAYWASFGTALDRARERAKALGQQPILETIIGTDERVLVTNTQDYPFRCICSLLITAQNGSQYLGTGWLVGPRLVLTAGHCVYMSDEGGWVSQIEIIPGRNASQRPFDSVVASEFRSVTGWTVDGDRDYDYGAILLSNDRRYGDELGWFGYSVRPDDYFPGIDLNLSGYPGDGGKQGPDRQDGTQWRDHRQVKEVDQKQISYEIDTFGGQSGSPVWEVTADGTRYGLAIHTWGTSVSNGATRITQEVFDNIVLWSGQVP